jgi:thioredoxin-like negative regulator of GroEL
MRLVTELELKARIGKGKGGPPVVVAVTRRRARPAEELSRALSALPAHLAARIDTLGVDADSEPRLCDELRVRLIPELLVFVDGRLVERAAGALDPIEAASFIEDALARA